MTIHQFPSYRIVRTEAEVEIEKRQGATPLALFFFPARLWINFWSRWMDLMIVSTHAPREEGDMNVTFHFGRFDRDR